MGSLAIWWPSEHQGHRERWNRALLVYRAGNASNEVDVDGTRYKFPVSLEDLGTATLLAEHKAITLMRYIRKALDGKTFVKA